MRAADQDDESLIEPGQMVVTITRDGFIKRTPLETFRAQNRGGRGRTGGRHARRRHRHPQLQRAHAPMGAVLLLAAARRSARRSGACRKPAPTGKGRALVNLLPELGADTITTVLPLPQDESAVGQPASGVRHRERAMCGATGCPISATSAPAA